MKRHKNKSPVTNLVEKRRTSQHSNSSGRRVCRGRYGAQRTRRKQEEQIQGTLALTKKKKALKDAMEKAFQ